MRISLPVPPSDNNIYFTDQWGGRKLKKEGKAYHRNVNRVVSQLLATSVADGADFIPHVPYEAVLTLYFQEIENKTWGEKKGAKTRYKKLDAGNRQKLVIDSVFDAIGIDDRHIFREVIRKRCDPEDPRVVVLVREQEARRD